MPNSYFLLPHLMILVSLILKFGLSEKHTKFEKIFLMVLANQLIYLVNIKTMRKIFFKLCVLLKKPKHYRYLQSKTDTAKSKVHDNSNATPQWFGPLCGAHIAAAMAAAAELKEEASSVHP